MKCLIISKKQIIAFISVLSALVLTFVGTVSVFAKTDRKIPIYSVDRNDKKIAISFDAAWGADDTDTLIEILEKYNVKATFFLVGGWVDKYPDEVKKLSEAGHSIQNHSNSHPYMTKISKSNMVTEISACNEKIEAVTGIKPILFRPPYGDYNDDVITTVYSQKMYPIQWSVDSLDWMEKSTPDSIIQNVTSKVTDGSIILMHNDAEHTPEALPTILKTLQDKGYEFVPIVDLIYKIDYETDHTGKQYIKKDG